LPVYRLLGPARGSGLAASYPGNMESFATDEGVGVGKEVVLDPDLGDGTLAQLAHEAAHVVEAALAGVAIYENGQCVVSAMHSLEHLGPGRLVAEARGVCQARVL